MEKWIKKMLKRARNRGYPGGYSNIARGFSNLGKSYICKIIMDVFSRELSHSTLLGGLTDLGS